MSLILFLFKLITSASNNELAERYNQWASEYETDCRMNFLGTLDKVAAAFGCD